MRDQRFGRAEVFRERAEFDTVHESNTGFDAAFDLERDECAARRLLLACELELRKRLETRIQDLSHARMRFEEARDLQRIRGMLGHAQADGLHALKRQPRRKRRLNRTDRVARERETLV